MLKPNEMAPYWAVALYAGILKNILEPELITLTHLIKHSRTHHFTNHYSLFTDNDFTIYDLACFNE
jgi:hypothetical protein